MREHIAKKGLTKEFRIGYAMGLNYPPDWGEHTASLRPGDPTILEPNMTFHMILGMWMDDYGFECSESRRVSAFNSSLTPFFYICAAGIGITIGPVLLQSGSLAIAPSGLPALFPRPPTLRETKP